MFNSFALRIIDRRPFADGHVFGSAGVYERPGGRAAFPVDPRAAIDTDVVDLDKAPTNSGSTMPATGS